MWVQVSLFPTRTDLVVAILKNGEVYWKASDVGRFLGYAAPYSFARRHATLDLVSMIPQELAGNRKHIWVFTLDQMIKVIRDTSKNHHLPFPEPNLFKVWWQERGRVANQFPPCPAFAQHRAPRLIVKEEGELSVQEWVTHYALMARTWLDKYHLGQVDLPPLSVNPPSVEASDSMMDPPSVEPSNLKSPPSSVKPPLSDRRMEESPSTKNILWMKFGGDLCIPHEIHIVTEDSKYIYYP